MAILRHHHEKEFTIVPNSLITDRNLHMRDIGLLCYLLHLPEEWEFTVNGLASILPHEGRDAITASLKRIEQAGYLSRERYRDENGRMLEAVWTVSDVPMTENPAQENPAQGSPIQIKNISNKVPNEQSTQAISNKVHSAEQIERRDTERPVIKKKDMVSPDKKMTIREVKQRFGDEQTEDAIDFVTHYIEHVYPAYTGRNHPSVSRASKAVYAFKILECADEMACQPDFIESLMVMAAEREIEYDPLIYLVTRPHVLGHWLLESGEFSYDLIRGTIYDFEGG